MTTDPPALDTADGPGAGIAPGPSTSTGTPSMGVSPGCPGRITKAMPFPTSTIRSAPYQAAEYAGIV